VISASWSGFGETLLLTNETILVIWRTLPETIVRHDGRLLNQANFHQDQW
jgi:hypothetical protein